MPINPELILGIKPPQFAQRDPLDDATKILTLKHLLQQGDMGGLQFEEAQRKADADRRIAALFQANPKATSAEVMGIDPTRGMAFRASELQDKKVQSEIGAHDAKRDKDRFEAASQHAARTASLFSGATDQASYEQALNAGTQTGLFTPQQVANFPAQYDPRFVEFVRKSGIKEVERLADLRAREQAAETARHNRGTEANTVRGQDMSAQTAREGHGVTMRGQNMTDARAQQTLEQGRWTNDLARGIQINTATGATRPITADGVPVTPKDDAPEAMLKAAGYADRMRKAGAILERMAPSGKPGLMETATRNSPIASNISRDPARQQYYQAAEDWVRAKLRQESGAVIADQEMEREIRTYFPQIGDSDAVIKQKSDARATAEHAMKTAAGRANTPGAIAPSPASPRPKTSGIKFLGFE